MYWESAQDGAAPSINWVARAVGETTWEGRRRERADIDKSDGETKAMEATEATEENI